MKLRALCATLLGISFCASPAWAWEKHRFLMPSILSSASLNEDLPALSKAIDPPCAEQDREMYLKLATEFALNPKPKDGVLPTAPEACARKVAITGRDVLASFVVDEPDMGMDQDLPFAPESYDPEGFQKWMGGTRGSTSQGFRHMYFGGWQFWHPIHTFQIPTGPIGMAPSRAATFAIKARQLIQSGDWRAAWGYRVLGWALHYVQDLAQPFHSTQIPSMRMVPWYVALEWPPQRGFDELVSETTRTISNYHFAYEGYTFHKILLECLERPQEFSSLKNDPKQEAMSRDPLMLAQRTARASVQVAPSVGSAVVAFFGPGLKDRGVDLPRGVGVPNYKEMALRPDLVDQREALHKATCVALANASWSSRALIQWVLAP